MIISVVMAAKNYGKYIAMAIESVIAQTHQEWELVIVDDGSDDDTCDVVRQYLHDRRVRYFQSDKLGQSRAKNLGVRLCKYDVIAFLDADDAWLPAKLDRQIKCLNDDVGVVACGRIMIDESTLHEPRTSASDVDRSLTLAARLISRDDVFISNPICFSSVMVKREVFDRCGLFDESLDLAIDYDLWLRVSRHYKIISMNENLVLYRTGHGNLSKKQADRISTAFGVAHGHHDGLSAQTLNEFYGSTCQSMAWMHRSEEKSLAVKWYRKAMCWPGYRLSSLKGIAGTLLRKRGVTSAENRSVNY